MCVTINTQAEDFKTLVALYKESQHLFVGDDGLTKACHNNILRGALNNIYQGFPLRGGTGVTQYCGTHSPLLRSVPPALLVPPSLDLVPTDFFLLAG